MIPFVLLLLAFLLQSCRGVTIYSGCIPNERNALLTFKKSLHDNFGRLSSWKDEDCCKWKGVSCNNVSGHVIRLDLRNPHPSSYNYWDDELHNEWTLNGQLSSSLLGLKQLNYLDLSMNHFDNGPIPKFLGFFHNLRYLNLSLAGFTGFIPPHLGNLSSLEYLHLNNGDNEYSFIVDDSHWISRLTSLKHLTMQHTKFENFQNWIEALNVLPHIVELTLSSCNITHFPTSLPYVNFTNLSYLDLSSNFINLEMIPLWLFNIKSLTHIDFSWNNFISIPDALKNLTSLEYIDFSYNIFGGPIPHALKGLCKLHTLRISEAVIGRGMDEFKEMFSGCLKDSIENLDLSFNELNSSLPHWFGEMSKLKTLDLSYNLLFGSIPESFGRLVALQELILSYNNLNGTIPKSIGQHKLKTLDLSYNSLFGSIPESLGGLVALQELRLSYNNLNGTIPKSIRHLSNLVRLYLDTNTFDGVITEIHFASLAKLKELNLQSNNLILNVSCDWVPPFKLNFIDMGSCKIGPKFPQWLQTQANLSFLNLSNSNIVGTLPNWFWDVLATHDISEVTLDLSNNGIIGNLPPLPKLSFDQFDLSSNNFSGPLPPFLNVIVVFDVSNNSFSGSIQPILGNVSTTYLFLSRNKFSGEIPSSICLTNVVWMDLSWNQLTGKLPNCWNSNTYLDRYYLDFSRNNLYGNIPHTLGTLTKLLSLHLSHNNLNGSIPMILRNCVSLVTLDLGMNKFKGVIPTWIGEDLTNLKALILSSNNFMGNVPSNLSKLKALQIVDLSNNKLSGRIPQSFGDFNIMMNMQSSSLFLGFRFVLSPYPMEHQQLTIKKGDWTYDKLLTQLSIIDLSFNNLSGQIPKELGKLHGLISLNLSGNHLVGTIPDTIGSMHSLESLDFSINELSGNIPLCMSNLTALEILDLSYNNLSGRIPLGNQLQTLSNESYIGNPKLCGFPLSRSCDSDKAPNVEVYADEVTKSDYSYVSIALGFVLGLWVVWVTFFLNKRWKDAYFQYVDYVYDAIYVAVAVNINRFRRKIDNETGSD